MKQSKRKRSTIVSTGIFQHPHFHRAHVHIQTHKTPTTTPNPAWNLPNGVTCADFSVEKYGEIREFISFFVLFCFKWEGKEEVGREELEMSLNSFLSAHLSLHEMQAYPWNVKWQFLGQLNIPIKNDGGRERGWRYGWNTRLEGRAGSMRPRRSAGLHGAHEVAARRRPLRLGPPPSALPWVLLRTALSRLPTHTSGWSWL